LSFSPEIDGWETQLIGKTGRVTGKIGPGLVGEVMVAVRGGAEAFYAHPVDPRDEIAVGAIVVIIEYHPPRTVYVAPASI
jgi:hypothetical protein